MATDEPRRNRGQKGGDAKSNRRGSVQLPKHHPEGTVNRDSWLAFLDDCISLDEEGRVCFRGQWLRGSHPRTLYRWQQEGATPVWHKVDAFLCKYGGNFMDFELWCLTEERPLWQVEEPSWWNEEPEDL